ncbi:NUDIX domain-containing protein [Prochlorococcus marinus]|uniref:NUDIX domain-containing protein n=1 Tax=Prochlorococcus marinus TaxID=1219 RepID=UPI0022B45854|nr:NUDIX domain-containing protein [Prochlorococcus marinus]
MITEKLSEEIWRTCVDSIPIFGIDMIIFSQKYGVLMGRRINNPAKGKLFVPGGRVYKNERIIDAFNRILISETGLIFSFNKTTSLGLYEHFYNVTSWSTSECSTHYIIEARLIEIEPENIKQKINLNEQHSNFEWISLEDIQSNTIHSYSKMYLNKIKDLKAK